MPDGGRVARYRQVFGLANDTALTKEQVRQHWELESALSQELRSSAPAARWETFERCYDRLYSELPWLVGTGGKANPGLWTGLIGASGARVYEVGSGAGELAMGLARALRDAGFRRVRSVLHSPRILPGAHPSRLHLALMFGVETALAPLGDARARLPARRLRGPLRLDVFLVAERAI